MSYLARRYQVISIVLAILFTAGLIPVAAQGAELVLESPAYVLMEPVSGEVIAEKNPHQKMEPASVTKLMTLVVAVEALDAGKVKLTDKVAVSENAWKMGGAQIYLEKGEEMTYNDLLASIAVGSANDSCVAVAEHLYGTQEEFVRVMNQRARELGMNDTNYVNCHGLHTDGHYTSAYDQALLSQYAVTRPELMKLTSTKEYDIRKMHLYNHNKLLWWYPGSDGLKTGWHPQANYCLAATSVRDGMRLVAVTLGAPQPRGNFRDCMKLMNLGFARYSYQPMVEPGQGFGFLKVKKGRVERVNVVAADKGGALMIKGGPGDVTTQLELPSLIEAPVNAGQKVGEVVIYRQQQEVQRVTLVAEDDVPRGSFLSFFADFMYDMTKMK
ncbi:MAG: D-alanyl-D-alanine carboxypeptidase [Firmicutes bacterium]|nr:D-alanyl-D-alanine carboxypeptidase [Bacillota bacterium]